MLLRVLTIHVLLHFLLHLALGRSRRLPNIQDTLTIFSLHGMTNIRNDIFHSYNVVDDGAPQSA